MTEVTEMDQFFTSSETSAQLPPLPISNYNSPIVPISKPQLQINSTMIDSMPQPQLPAQPLTPSKITKSTCINTSLTMETLENKETDAAHDFALSNTLKRKVQELEKALKKEQAINKQSYLQKQITEKKLQTIEMHNKEMLNKEKEYLKMIKKSEFSKDKAKKLKEDKLRLELIRKNLMKEKRATEDKWRLQMKEKEKELNKTKGSERKVKLTLSKITRDLDKQKDMARRKAIEASEAMNRLKNLTREHQNFKRQGTYGNLLPSKLVKKQAASTKKSVTFQKSDFQSILAQLKELTEVKSLIHQLTEMRKKFGEDLDLIKNETFDKEDEPYVKAEENRLQREIENISRNMTALISGTTNLDSIDELKVKLRKMPTTSAEKDLMIDWLISENEKNLKVPVRHLKGENKELTERVTELEESLDNIEESIGFIQNDYFRNLNGSYLLSSPMSSPKIISPTKSYKRPNENSNLVPMKSKAVKTSNLLQTDSRLEKITELNESNLSSTVQSQSVASFLTDLKAQKLTGKQYFKKLVQKNSEDTLVKLRNKNVNTENLLVDTVFDNAMKEMHAIYPSLKDELNAERDQETRSAPKKILATVANGSRSLNNTPVRTRPKIKTPHSSPVKPRMTAQQELSKLIANNAEDTMYRMNHLKPDAKVKENGEKLMVDEEFKQAMQDLEKKYPGLMASRGDYKENNNPNSGKNFNTPEKLNQSELTEATYTVDLDQEESVKQEILKIDGRLKEIEEDITVMCRNCNVTGGNINGKMYPSMLTLRTERNKLTEEKSKILGRSMNGRVLENGIS